MHPVLFEIAGFPFHAYGVMVGIAVALGVLGTVWMGRREGMPAEWFWDLALALIVGIVVGGRLEYVRTQWGRFYNHPMRVFELRDGGMVFYGGFVGVVLCLLIVMKLRRMPVWKVFDIYAIFLPFGIALARIGCLLAGCCYGLPTALPWGIRFPSGNGPPAGVALHPTQLYEAVYCVLLGLGLVWLKARRRFEGQVFAAFFLFYPPLRAVNELYRGDAIRGYAFGQVTNAQAISLALFLVGVALWIVRGTARRAPSS